MLVGGGSVINGATRSSFLTKYEKNKRLQARFNTRIIVFNGKQEQHKKYRYGKDASQCDMEECNLGNIQAFGQRLKRMFRNGNPVFPNIME